MKRIFGTLILAAILAFTGFALAGCGNGGNATTGGDATVATPDTPAAPDTTDAPVTIRFSMWDTVDETVSFIQAFHDANPDIRVELVNIPEDYSTVINTMVLGGTAPDIILSWEVDLPRFARMGAILPLDERVAQSDLVDVNDFIPAVSALAEITDGIYGIPWVYASHFLYFNKDMFDAAGIPHPTDDWTWDDLAAAAQALTIRDGAITTQWGMTAIDFVGIWWSMIGQGGDDIVGPDMRLSLGDGLRRALEWQYDMTNVYEVMPPPGGGLGDLFVAEMAAMTRQGNWFVAGYSDLPFNWDIVPLPRDNRAFSNLHTGFFTISANSEHPEEAWRFIEFMMSYEGQVLLSEFSANPSAMRSVAAGGYHFVQGTHGPQNWDAFGAFERYGEFTYVLLNSAVTGDLVGQFNAVLLGQTTIDHVINVEVPNAQSRLDALD